MDETLHLMINHWCGYFSMHKSRLNAVCKSGLRSTCWPTIYTYRVVYEHKGVYWYNIMTATTRNVSSLKYYKCGIEKKDILCTYAGIWDSVVIPFKPLSVHAIMESHAFVSAFHLLLSIVCASTTSCVDSNDLTTSGSYDPDGDGGVESFPIKCEEEYIVIHHLQEDRTLVNGSRGAVCINLTHDWISMIATVGPQK